MQLHYWNLEKPTQCRNWKSLAHDWLPTSVCTTNCTEESHSRGKIDSGMREHGSLGVKDSHHAPLPLQSKHQLHDIMHFIGTVAFLTSDGKIDLL